MVANTKEKIEGGAQSLPRINFRPLVFCALGLFYGGFLYFRGRFGGIGPSDLCVLLLLVAFALPPVSCKRAAAIGLAVLLFGGVGAGLAHLRTARFLETKEGVFTVTGTVCSFTVKRGRTAVILENLFFDGESVGGKLAVQIESEDVRAGDIVEFRKQVTANDLPMSEDSYSNYLFYSDIRYRAPNVDYKKLATSGNPFYRVSSALYDVLSAKMGGEEAEVAYALLTGNSGSMDAGLSEAMRRGGIAHIFAVSGLHIGIVFGLAMQLFRPLGRKRSFLALLAALLYTALCGFPVSAVRALVVCVALAFSKVFGRKFDFLSALGAAALCLLTFDIADLLSPGFRLSFAACLGLALLAGPIRRLLFAIPHAPRPIADYLSANLSVQIFTFPVMLACFGYVSVWGTLLNLLILPLLPMVFSYLLLSAALSLMIPPAAAGLLVVPKGLLSLLMWLFTHDFGMVLQGFVLGMGASFLVIALIVLSGRVRLSRGMRTAALCLLAVLFAFAVSFENVPMRGVRVEVADGKELVLLKTRDHTVLVMGQASLADCEDFLRRETPTGPDACLVVAEDEVEALGRAVFLHAGAIFACDEVPTGLFTPIQYTREVALYGMQFRYVRRDRLVIVAENVVLEVDFSEEGGIGADFLLRPSEGYLKFFLRDGIMYA